MAGHRVIGLLALGLLGACGARQMSDGAITTLPDDSFAIETRTAWALPVVERTLDQAVNFCAGQERQTELLSTRVLPDSYGITFRCGQPLGAVALARGTGGAVSRVVLAPQPAASRPLVLTAPVRPTAEPVVAGASAVPIVVPARPAVATASFTPGNPFVAGAPPAPLQSVAGPRAAVPQFLAAPFPAIAATPAAPARVMPAPTLATGLPGATAPLGAVPPASFWQAPR